MSYKVTRYLKMIESLGAQQARSIDVNHDISDAESLARYLESFAFEDDPMSESIQSARATLRLQSGDVEDMAVFAAALAKRAGLPYRVGMTRDGRLLLFVDGYDVLGPWRKATGQ